MPLVKPKEKEKREDFIASKSLTFVNSDRIFEKLKLAVNRFF